MAVLDSNKRPALVSRPRAPEADLDVVRRRLLMSMAASDHSTQLQISDYDGVMFEDGLVDNGVPDLLCRPIVRPRNAARGRHD
jgi:hypothetical protein